MSACEKCWEDSFLLAMARGISQVEAYEKLLNERKNKPCTPKEQAGQYWDDERQCDIRETYGGGSL